MKSSRRSVSPFGTVTVEEAPFAELEAAIEEKAPPLADPAAKPKLNQYSDLANLPYFLNKVMDAAASDSPHLIRVSQFLTKHRPELETAGLFELVYAAMLLVFDRKTEIFLIDHHNKESCEKMGWQDEYRDNVLFAKERDALVGHFFAPATEQNPGRFAEFLTRWHDTDNTDRALHFLDFCSGSKNPTFEHYLLFSHPALQRLVSNKASLKVLLNNAKPVLSKLSSPTWEANLKKTLDLH